MMLCMACGANQRVRESRPEGCWQHACRPLAGVGDHRGECSRQAGSDCQRPGRWQASFGRSHAHWPQPRPFFGGSLSRSDSGLSDSWERVEIDAARREGEGGEGGEGQVVAVDSVWTRHVARRKGADPRSSRALRRLSEGSNRTYEEAVPCDFEVDMCGWSGREARLSDMQHAHCRLAAWPW